MNSEHRLYKEVLTKQYYLLPQQQEYPKGALKLKAIGGDVISICPEYAREFFISEEQAKNFVKDNLKSKLSNLSEKIEGTLQEYTAKTPERLQRIYAAMDSDMQKSTIADTLDVLALSVKDFSKRISSRLNEIAEETRHPSDSSEHQ